MILPIDWYFSEEKAEIQAIAPLIKIYIALLSLLSYAKQPIGPNKKGFTSSDDPRLAFAPLVEPFFFWNIN